MQIIDTIMKGGVEELWVYLSKGGNPNFSGSPGFCVATNLPQPMEHFS